jgi:predicted membrane protein
VLAPTLVVVEAARALDLALLLAAVRLAERNTSTAASLNSSKPGGILASLFWYSASLMCAADCAPVGALDIVAELSRPTAPVLGVAEE